MTSECPVCGGSALEPFIERRSVPLLLNRVFDDADAARRAGRGALALAMCAGCGFTLRGRRGARLVLSGVFFLFFFFFFFAFERAFFFGGARGVVA